MTQLESLVPDLVGAHGGTSMSGLQQLPLAGDVVGGELCDDAVCDLGESIGGQGQDGRTCTRETDAKQAWLSGRSHELENLGQTGDQRLAVWLVHLVLHGQEDHIRVRRGSSQCRGEQGRALKVENLVDCQLRFKFMSLEGHIRHPL